MTELLTTSQMRALEQAAIASGSVTGLDLMERAGAGVVAAILDHWPDRATVPGRVVVLCGPGNNGGDGFVVARLLHQRGWGVRVLFAGEAEKLPQDAAVNYERWLGLGPVEALTEKNLQAGETDDIYVDAIYGIGLSRPVTGEVARVLAQMAEANGVFGHYQRRLVAVDVPSGLCADSGHCPGLTRDSFQQTLHVALTVTFHTPKAGHMLGLGPRVCGRLVVADLGLRDLKLSFLAQDALNRATYGQRLVPSRADAPSQWNRLFDPLRDLAKPSGHKFDHGHAVILSGPAERSGAARLAARAALRVGAGLVTLAAQAGSAAFIAPALTAVMLRGIRNADDFAGWLAADARISAVVVGPGLGTDDRAAALVAAVLAARRRTVLDADALTLIAALPDLRAQVHKDCVLTPHGGEFARLWPDIAARLEGPRPPQGPLKGADNADWAERFGRWQAELATHRDALAAERAPLYSKLDATRDAARDIGATVLFKGPDTVIAGPEGQVAIHAAAYGREAPWLATAGSGDVLAGLIGGLMARGLAPGQAAELGAFLHVECARSFGPGLIAEDLPEELPNVLRALGL